MSKRDSFVDVLTEGQIYKKDFITLGTGILDGEAITEANVKVPLKTMNRHGLIAGATGTGKTKTLQVIAEQLSLKGVPSVLMDLKGDLSGLAKPGEAKDFIISRSEKIGVDYNPQGLPVELMSISDEKGVKLKATVSEFGPVLMSQILELNDTQRGVMALVFRYCDLHHLPLLDLKDLKRVLQFIINEGKEQIKAEFGQVSSASVNTIMRKIIELEQQGADKFFGERSFEVNDFVRTEDGKGVISIIRLTDIQSKPKLFSTFMLSLLSEVYETFPEQGDADQPKLCIFIDEAHLVFSTASKDLLEKIEAIVKLIRSKGVGVYFCTQTPTDVPDSVLGQLGLKVQHALRAFTAKDRKAITKTAENYPITEFYDTAETLTSMGIGEALITALSEKGIPTPLAHTLVRAPISRMDILSTSEIDDLVSNSSLTAKYNVHLDRESAFEMLNSKLDEVEKEQEKATLPGPKPRTTTRTTQDESLIEELSKNTMVRQIGRTIFRELTRGILGSFSRRR
ncbi:MAG: putative enzyme with P-loop containing nucleotide triphosphate hydrolase domain YjgR [Algoriphagus marincola HL-49]|uniref:Putative enzyme with P-loop containing nucleotide triphosphate hydrolase domain YjgR n=1 Tax=Algoriphagus marincola HL-49 TaxID=1305737 RepID=A0A0N8KFW8_9BACT|nr:MAG: putative enzyme with P-loop containing nucleotide triphosphate hydrolase domain YjgR [Algoriphagus marincola HL-49]